MSDAPNWATMVADLKRLTGYSDGDVAKLLGVTRAHVHHLRTGKIKEPGWTLGDRIILEWRRANGLDVPRIASR